MEPRIQYAKTEDGVNIAYCVVGEGQTIVRVPTLPLSHVLRAWETFPNTLFVKPLAEVARVVLYDSRGAGLSDRDPLNFSMDAMLRDLEAVIAGAGLAEPFALCSAWDGVPICLRYSAENPGRVSHLVLVEGYVEYADYLESSVMQMELSMRGKDWVLYTETLAQVFMGFDDADYARQLAQHLRACVEPEALWAAWGAIADWRFSDVLPRVKAPTLVLHNENNTWLSVDAGRRLATSISEARFLVIDDPKYLSVPRLIAEFMGLPEVEPVTPSRPRAATVHTILFTDMESSTALTQRLGDAKAQELVRAHNTIVREALKAHEGSEIKHTGDGIMASFAGASSALGCAVAILKAVAARAAKQPETPLGLRVGLNAGEPVVEEQDLFGASVQLARRICDHAAPGQILASNVVRELAMGKGFLFGDIGEVVPKGFEEPVRLYEVRWQEKD